MKCCSKCGETKPHGAFAREKRHTDGLSSDCKACRNARQNARRAADPEAARQTMRDWRASHPGANAQFCREWSARNPGAVRRCYRAWYAENKEHVAAYAREYNKRNKERKARRDRDYLIRMRIEDPDRLRDRAADRHHRRRARILGNGTAVRVDIKAVYERDGWRCGVCGKRVNPKRRWPDPLSPSIDHIVPISQGGAHRPENLQLAHVGCNRRRGAGRIPAQLPLIS